MKLTFSKNSYAYIYNNLIGWSYALNFFIKNQIKIIF